jgi:Mg2+ and Co2+ transporter CorA
MNQSYEEIEDVDLLMSKQEELYKLKESVDNILQLIMNQQNTIQNKANSTKDSIKGSIKESIKPVPAHPVTHSPTT